MNRGISEEFSCRALTSTGICIPAENSGAETGSLFFYKNA
jgi:hypothetical protein